jgi:hypothetical protein
VTSFATARRQDLNDLIADLPRLAIARNDAESALNEALDTVERLLAQSYETNVSHACAVIEGINPRRGRRARDMAIARFEALRRAVQAKSDTELAMDHARIFDLCRTKSTDIRDAIASLTPGDNCAFLIAEESLRRAAGGKRIEPPKK